jgi:hypothetical protein
VSTWGFLVVVLAGLIYERRHRAYQFANVRQKLGEMLLALAVSYFSVIVLYAALVAFGFDLSAFK